MADGGGINLRLSLKGAEQVRAELDKIGPAGAKMGRELDRAMRTPGPGLSALNAGVSAGRTNLESFAGRAGVVGTGLQALGGWGLAAAVGVAAAGTAAAFTVNRLREAMTFAADLTDTAERIGVNVENLQAWRFVADEAGVSVEAFQGNLEKLNGTLGKIKAGIGDAKLKPWLEELGITPASLETIMTADQMMVLLADRLGGIADRSKQVAAARAFGVEDSLPILRLGAERVRELMEEARRLGLVLNQETIVALDEADRSIEKASQRIESQLRFAVAGLADDFADLVTQIAEALTKLNEFLGKFSAYKAQANAMYGDDFVTEVTNGNSGQALWSAMRSVVSGRTVRAARAIRDGDDLAVGVPSVAGMQAFASGRPAAEGELNGHSSSGGGGTSGADRAAERRRQEAEREIDRLLQTDFAVQREWLREVVAGRDTAMERAQAARQLLGLDEEEARVALEKAEASIRSAGLADEEVEQRLAQIRLLRTDVGAAARRAIDEREAQERREALAVAEEQYVQIAGELLSLASSSARTSGERQDIELQILELSQRRQRADLQAAIEAEKEPEARARLVAALDRLPALFEAQVVDVRRRTAGPLAQWRDRQLQGPGEASEWLQGAALDALDGINDGLIDAFRNVDSASDAFERMGQVAVDALAAIADALLKVAIQRLMIEPLTNALFGGSSGSGSGGLLGNLFGAFAGNLFGGASTTSKMPQKLYGAGKARGGLQGATGWTPVGERGMELVDLPVGSRVFDADTTQRTLLDFDARMRAMASTDGARRAPTINMPISVVNRTSEPVTARTNRMPNGGVEMILEPAVRSAVAKMGADGSLAQAHGLTPRPIRRG